MPQELSASARKVQAILQQRGFGCEVVELSDSTRTAREAAQAVGCQVEQIVKSLIFRGREPEALSGAGERSLSSRRAAVKRTCRGANRESRCRFCAPAYRLRSWRRAARWACGAAGDIHR